MFCKGINIQKLYELIIEENKRVLLFGAGGACLHHINEINKYIWYLCDNWQTPSYIELENREYRYSYIPIEEFVDCIIDNDKEKQQGVFELNGRTLKIESADYLKEIEPSRYVLLLTTDKYEKDIREQLLGICNLNNMPIYSFHSNMHYYEKHSRGLIVDRVIIPYMDTLKAIPHHKFPEDEYEKIKKAIEEGEYVSSGIAFQITTICNLKCKYCGDYIPRLREHKNTDIDKVLEDIDIFFSVVGRCLYVQLTSAEAVLYPQLDLILEKLIPMEKVQHIEIVTNGITYPKNEKVLKLLSHPKGVIFMSNYNMPQKTDESRKIYQKYGIHVRFAENQKWSIQGTEPYKREIITEDLSNIFMTCWMAEFCPDQILDGRLTGCGKIQRFAEVTDFESSHDFIDFARYSNKEELKQALINLNLEQHMDGCAWCDVPYIDSSKMIMPAVDQLA